MLSTEPRTANLAERTAIITGASRGIGLAAARALHAAGANVVLTARSADEAAAAASAIGTRALGVGAHASDPDAAQACLERALHEFGSVDILVNNAATSAGLGPVLRQSHAQFTKTMDVNLWAPIHWSRLAYDAWMSRHGGQILNTASIGGMSVSHDIGLYNVSKAALIHLTRQLALELAPTVRVNAVAPGVVRTRMAEALWRDQEEAVASSTLLGRIGEPDDIGSLIAFLVSDDASWITGQTVVIDGGQTLSTGSIESPIPPPRP